MNESDKSNSQKNEVDQQHRFIIRSSTKPKISEINKLSTFIINHLLKEKFTVSKLRKLGQFDITWNDKKSEHKSSFTLEEISDYVRTFRTFDHTKFNLPAIDCDWLDGLVGIGMSSSPIYVIESKHYARLDLSMSFGDNFPIKPCIDREGAAYRSLQVPLQKNIIRLFNKLIDQSHRASKFDGLWLSDFRMLLNDCVSILEVTLHQLYFMAQYKGTDIGWNFDENALGPRENVRVKDKLRWIGKIEKPHIELRISTVVFYHIGFLEWSQDRKNRDHIKKEEKHQRCDWQLFLLEIEDCPDGILCF